ncbi:MAG TPA: DNA mismatch repair protein MutS [Candidatus Megaira endosymbiont of Nemacystus decipiens]|nr:DNA mismatch repair protein MutS [Candidatus Megaera endosymbiont of Nemacystus decipiens]
MQESRFKEKYHYVGATPVMQQYLDAKFLHLDCLLLFRMGDFYELFYEDALTASRALGIALTKRGKSNGNEIPMCGVPHHSLENYLNKLLQDGFKVAICDQMERPEDAKKRDGYKAVVKRSVTRIITPGTITEESLLSSHSSNYLATVTISKNTSCIAYIDLSTSYIALIELPVAEILNELVKLGPKEILLAEKFRSSKLADEIGAYMNQRISFQVDSFYSISKCTRNICSFYKIHDIKAIADLSEVQISALGAILEYISLTQKENMPQLPKPKIQNFFNYMSIDASTRKNLELMQTIGGGYKGSVFSCINKTVTKTGSRLLAEYLSNPLLDTKLINTRLNVVNFFLENIDVAHNLINDLKNTCDLERCITRLQMKRSTPKDLLSIKHTIEIAQKIVANFTAKFGLELPKHIDAIVKPLMQFDALHNIISDSIDDNAANDITSGGIIKRGYNPKVDELNDLLQNSRSYINELQNKYRKITSIDSLKINNNNVLGFFIDITSRNASKITQEQFIHRQTTVNSVRYTTSELQEIESKIVNARMLSNNLEQELYHKICSKVIENQRPLIKMAKSLALLDVFTSFAVLSEEYSYSRPILRNDTSFNIIDGRHPLVERVLARSNDSFVSNNCNLDFDNRVWLITGPNMAGKSTFLRQNAIIAILAQIGCFVPAESAEIGVVDKIFSRIGAGDDLGRGQSTFMLEMLETSNILAQATKNSLVILDEVGRGTSTYDGVAIAWSVLEYIHDKIRSRCLFATHYHELVKMKETFPALANYTVEIQEADEKILFLYKIIPGYADKSYGVHVAEIAGLPKSVITKAKRILAKLEKKSYATKADFIETDGNNLNLFTNFENNIEESQEELQRIRDTLDKIDPDTLSPKEALDFVYNLKKLI